MNKVKKIIIYTEITWNFLDQRHHHLARYFAKNGYSVTFVERVISRIPKLSEMKKKSFHQKTQFPEKTIPDNIRVVKSYFLPCTNRIFNLWNGMYWSLAWKQKQQGSLVYSFLNNPYLIGNIPDSKLLDRISIFDVIHNWEAFPWNSEMHKINYHKCLDLYSKIVVDSPKINSNLLNRRLSPHLMMPGVSPEWFNKNLLADNSSRPRVVFFGNLRSNSDVQLVEYFIKNKLFEFHFFGVIDSAIDLQIPIESNHGARPSVVVADFLNTHDVVLLPYMDNSFSSTIAPAKYFECLATGALIISRAKLNHLPGWKRYVYSVNLLGSVTDEIKALLLAHEKKTKSQVDFAMQNSWDKRFFNLLKHIFEK